MKHSNTRAGRGGSNVTPRNIEHLTLADLGIPRHSASQAMQLAAMPEAEFEAALAESRLKLISERLGHSGIAITTRFYVHVTDAMQQQAVETFAGFLARPVLTKGATNG